MRITAFGGMLLLAATIGDSEARPECYGWSEAGPIIADYDLIPIQVIREEIMDRFGGELIKARLCNQNGVYVYKLVVLGRKGNVRKIYVDSLTGQPIRFDGDIGGPTSNATMFGGTGGRKLRAPPPLQRSIPRRPSRKYFPPGR